MQLTNRACEDQNAVVSHGQHGGDEERLVADFRHEDHADAVHKGRPEIRGELGRAGSNTRVGSRRTTP